MVQNMSSSGGSSGSSSGGSSGSNSVTPPAAGSPTAANTDEKVGLIDPDTYATVNQPGYLNADYFETEVDADPDTLGPGTGRAAIKPSVLIIDQNITRERRIPLATGKNAIAIGEGSEAQSMNEIAIGKYNTIGNGNPTEWDLEDRLIVAGKGTDENNRADAFLMYKSGFMRLYNALQLGKFQHSEGAPPLAGTLQYTPEDLLQLAIDQLWVNVLLDGRTIAVCQNGPAGSGYVPPTLPSNVPLYGGFEVFGEQTITWI
jgi:hypothetical protein